MMATFYDVEVKDRDKVLGLYRNDLNDFGLFTLSDLERLAAQESRENFVLILERMKESAQYQSRNLKRPFTPYEKRVSCQEFINNTYEELGRILESLKP